MTNKEELNEFIKHKIEDVREYLVGQIDQELMGLYDTLTEYINTRSDSEPINNEETSALSNLIASQIQTHVDDEYEDDEEEYEDYEEEAEEIDEHEDAETEEDPDQVVNLAALLHQQVVSQAQVQAEAEPEAAPTPVVPPARRPLSEIVAELVNSVNQEMDDNNEIKVDSLLNPANGVKVEDLSDKIKQAILENDIKKQ